MAELLFNGYTVSITQDRKILEICGITLCLYLTILYCIFKFLLRGRSCVLLPQ